MKIQCTKEMYGGSKRKRMRLPRAFGWTNKKRKTQSAKP